MMGAAGIASSVSADVRVMLVEDSAVVRGMVRKWLEVLPGIVVVNSASNGQVAIDTVAALNPDIIILDIEMPVMDGLTALPSILRKAPRAKVLIASTLSLRNAEISLKAMNLGASDYIAKPSFARDGNDARALFKEDLVRKVTGLAHSIHHRSGRVSPARQSESGWGPMPAAGTIFKFRKGSAVKPRVLAIGSSTGGPAALNAVIENAKSALGSVPVLIAQHMPPTFTMLLGEKLSRVGGLEGGEAKDGDLVVPGKLYVAPGDMHMRVKRRGNDVKIVLDQGAPINHCRPSVDPLFESIAEVYGSATLAAVLTGMGSDGANGAVQIADAGGTVIAQDEASSVVWGMPGAAAAAGACTSVVELSEIGGKLSRMISQGAGK